LGVPRQSRGFTFLNYIENSERILFDGCARYSNFLPTVFAAQKDKFKDSSFAVTVAAEHIKPFGKYERRMKAASKELFFIAKPWV
jgi:hypothetical protein